MNSQLNKAATDWNLKYKYMTVLVPMRRTKHKKRKLVRQYFGLYPSLMASRARASGLMKTSSSSSVSSSLSPLIYS